jgi:hypothetical protein
MNGLGNEVSPRGTTERGRRRRTRQRPHSFNRLSVGLLSVLLAGSALWFGAQQTPALVACALASAALALLAPPAHVPRAAWVTTGLALVTCFELVPLPSAWVAHLTPTGHAVWRGALELVGAPSDRAVPLTVDPGATALEALKWAAYGCVLLGASGMVARRAVPLAVPLFASALLVALITLAHGVFDVQRIYGIFRPTDASPWVRGPFVNGNHLAGYLNLGLFAGVGFWLSHRKERLGWLVAGGAPFMVTCVLMSSSRAGIACLFLGGLILLAYRFRLGSFRRSNSLQLIGGVLGLGAALTMLLGGARLWEALADRDVRTKTSVWYWSLDLIRDYPWFGAGRGAFETAFQPYRRLLGRDWTTVFAHAENLPLEWAADWGVPVALVALGACLWCARPAFKAARHDPGAAGFVAGLVALVVQNLADFSLELFAVAVAAGVAFSGAEAGERAIAGRSRRPVLPLVGLVLLTATYVVMQGFQPVQIVRQSLARAADASRDRASLAALERRVRAAVLEHPGDAYAPLIGGLVAERQGKSPFKWLGRALERSPYDGRAHLALGGALARRGARTQALLEVRLAAVYDSTLRDAALAQAASWVSSRADLLAVFPEGMPGADLLAGLCGLVRDDLPVECARLVLQRTPTDSARTALAGYLLDAWEAHSSPCAPSRAVDCSAEVRSLLDALHAERDGSGWAVGLLRARYLALERQPREAAQVLLARCPADRHIAGCWDRALAFAAESRDLSVVRAVSERYAASHCSEAVACAQAHDTLAQTYSALGAWGHALAELNFALRDEPTTERWLWSAEVALRSGAARTAERTLDRVEHAGTLTEQQRQRVDALRAQLLVSGSHL